MQFLEQCYSVELRRPVHAEQRQVGDVLQRDVNVLAHLTTHHQCRSVSRKFATSTFHEQLA